MVRLVCSSPGICRLLVTGHPDEAKSSDAQILYVKWCIFICNVRNPLKYTKSFINYSYYLLPCYCSENCYNIA